MLNKRIRNYAYRFFYKMLKFLMNLVYLLF